MKRLNLITVLIPSLALALAPAGAALATTANQTAVASAITYLNSQQGSDGQIAGFSGINAWAVIAYEAAGTNPATVKVPGGTSLLDYLKNNPPTASATATDYERDILAITAANQDPYSFGGVNYVSALEAFDSGGQIGSAAAVNDDFFGIAALIAAGVPSNTKALTDALSFTLAQQRADGGFSYTTDTSTGSDVDDTAAALLALKAANNAGLSVSSQAISSAKSYMLGTKMADGGFPYDPNTPASWGGPVSDVSTTSWVIMALTTLGDGNSTAVTGAETWIRSQQQPDGSFPYNVQNLPGDTFDTVYAVIALSGGYWPLHVWDGPLPEGNNGGSVLGSQTGPSNPPTTRPTTPPSSTPTSSPSSSQPAGSVLGASTSGSGNSGGSKPGILPAAGTAANLLTLLTAMIVGLAAATAVYLRTRKSSQTRLDV